MATIEPTTTNTTTTNSTTTTGDAAPGPSPAGDGRTGRATRRRPWARMLVVLVGALVAAALVGWLGLRWITPHPYSGTVMQAPTAAPSMDGLVYADGTAVDIGAFDGDLLLLFFGYTNCPDVCPTTLSQVAAARQQLGGDADRVQVLFVSVDPERDGPTAIGDYVTSFDPDFLAATGEPSDVDRVASQYGIFFARGEALGGDDYVVDHTATLMGIDTEGHLRIVWPGMLEPDRLAADLRELL